MLLLDHASGINIILTRGNNLPDLVNNSKTASRQAVSELPDFKIGFKSSMFSYNSDSNPCSCVFIQFTFPFKVFISPLCAKILKG